MADSIKIKRRATNYRHHADAAHMMLGKHEATETQKEEIQNVIRFSVIFVIIVALLLVVMFAYDKLN